MLQVLLNVHSPLERTFLLAPHIPVGSLSLPTGAETSVGAETKYYRGESSMVGQFPDTQTQRPCNPKNDKRHKQGIYITRISNLY